MDGGFPRLYRNICREKVKYQLARFGENYRNIEKLPDLPVAALTAQPLAALPPYGCGVPFTGGERHAGWHYLRHKFFGARPPSLSFRGAKRRGNLLQPVTFSPRPTCYSTWYCEIATSAAPPRNDTSGSAEVHKSTSAVKFSPYRALAERRYRRNWFVRFIVLCTN